MRIEHLALNVPEPVAMADWYVRHLGMTVALRRGDGFFIADSSGGTVLELYRNPAAPVPDYGAMDPAVFHMAILTADLPRDRERLIAAGGRPCGPVGETDAGDAICVVRDPWGVCLQLVRRVTPLVAVPRGGTGHSKKQPTA